MQPNRRLTLALLFLAALASFFRAADTFAVEGQSVDFARDVRPAMKTYCFSCHGSQKTKGDVNLEKFADKPDVGKDIRFWQTLLTEVRDRNMPPKGKPQPTEEERSRLTEWISGQFDAMDFSRFPKDPGRVTARRLNRAEYNNTIRDLLGVETHLADAFPADGGGGGGFDNNADTLFVPSLLMEQYLGAAAEALRLADPKRLFTAKPDDKLSKRDTAKKTIATFVALAFRRPADDRDVDRYLKLFDRADARGDSFEKAIKLAIKAVLVSPQFLFRVEQDRPSAEPWPVTDIELASRLSYFIWASMPDEELMKTATDGKLHEEAVLVAQTRRMLKDPKSKALAENFGGQWLHFREIQSAAQPDRERFRDFTPAVRDAMYDEAVAFVDSVFRDDASLMTLIDADYTFLNEPLAKHYKIPKITGEEMRRVKLPDRSRGGVLGLGAVLTVTSYPLRTSPVLRGKWVLESVLGAPPPPPPPEVPDLPKDDAQPDGITFRKRLELHRSRPECASCHARMDALGFGLENYDPVGRWRTTQNNQPVDSAGVLSTGESFNGPAELKKVLLGRRDDFTRNVTEKLLAYALGRGLELTDQPTIREIAKAVLKDDDKAATLVVEIARSYPFRYRRNELPDKAP